MLLGIRFAILAATALGSAGSFGAAWQAPLNCEIALGRPVTADWLFSEISRIAAKRLDRKRLTKHTYLPYTEDLDAGATLHSSPVSPDSVWVLYLPTRSENIWRHLAPAERTILLEKLEEAFHSGEFDLQSELMRTGTSHPFYEMLKHGAVAFALELLGPNGGFSPIRFLGGALTGQCTGVCRHANLAFAGLLLELGISPQDLRIYSGYTKPVSDKTTQGHAFISARAGAAEPWRFYDATGHKEEESSHWHEFKSMPNPKPTNAERIQIRRLSNQMFPLLERFSVLQKEHPEFFNGVTEVTPTNWDIFKFDPKDTE